MRPALRLLAEKAVRIAVVKVEVEVVAQMGEKEEVVETVEVEEVVEETVEETVEVAETVKTAEKKEITIVALE